MANLTQEPKEKLLTAVSKGEHHFSNANFKLKDKLNTDTLGAAYHDVQMGWINEQQLANIKQECEKDQPQPEK